MERSTVRAAAILFITHAVLEGALPTSSVFALLSSLFLCAEGDESYFYVLYINMATIII